jgi:cytochrome P450
MTTADVEPVEAAIARYLRDTSSLTDPYPIYRRLREVDPVHWSEALGYWVVTSHRDAETCFRDQRLSRHAAGLRQFGWVAAPGGPPEIERAVTTWLSTILNLDPPDHTRLRLLISRAFTPRAVAAWQSRTEQVVDTVLAGVEDERRFDLLAEIAYPVPETVICEVLGVPVEDHDRWKVWNGGFNRAAIFAGRNRGVDDLAPDVRRRAQDALLRWYDYFSDLVRRRRGSTGDDLVSLLVRAEEEGDRLSENELIGTLTLLIGAGHDTTANLVANGMLALMRHPDQYALLRQEPQRAGDVVEEVLRYDGPARGQPRVALSDAAVAGRTIRAGDTVMVIVNAANRDPDRFPDPDRFDITRRDTGHLAFASGIHFCIGAALARMEAEVVFRKIAQLDTVLELDDAPLAYKPTHGRNLTALPVRRRRGA